MKIIFMQMAGMSTVYGINSLVRTVDLKLNSPFVKKAYCSLQGETSSLTARP